MSLSRADISIWLISLERDASRRAEMETQLKDLGLEFTWFKAIDGKTCEAELLQNADAEAYARNMGSPILPGKLGCYASHVAVWEKLANSDSKAALILEDDVVFHDDFNEALDLALRESDRWDTIRFNCIRAKMPVTTGTACGYKFNAYVGPFDGNASYLVKKSVATRILPNIWPQTRAFDRELNRFFRHDFRQIGLEPWPSYVDVGGTSSITGTGFALVKKPHWTRRLPHYRLKAANYFRRAFWLAKNGLLFGRSKN